MKMEKKVVVLPFAVSLGLDSTKTGHTSEGRINNRNGDGADDDDGDGNNNKNGNVEGQELVSAVIGTSKTKNNLSKNKRKNKNKRTNVLDMVRG